MVDGSRRALPVRISCFLIALALISVALMAALPHVSAQQTEGSVSIVPSFSNVLIEEERFSVFIVVEELEHFGVVSGVPSTGLGAFEFTLRFDPDVLEVAEVELGPTLEETGRSYQCLQRSDEPGIHAFACFSLGSAPPGPQGDLTLATVTFLPINPGSTLLFMEAGIAGPMGDDVPVDVHGVGAVSVRTAAATPTPGPIATSTPVTAATLTPGPIATSTPVTAATATPSSTPSDDVTATPEVEATEPAEPTAAPTDVDDETPPESTVLPPDTSADGGGSAGTVLLWSLAVAGSLAAIGVIGLTAVRWQRQRR